MTSGKTRVRKSVLKGVCNKNVTGWRSGLKYNSFPNKKYCNISNFTLSDVTTTPVTRVLFGFDFFVLILLCVVTVF